MTETMRPDAAAVIKRLMRPRPRPSPGEVCEMCGEPIADRHDHVADIADRRLMCTCRGCYLLFATDGAVGSRRRAVPQDLWEVEDFQLTDAQWDTLGIPVDLLFVFDQTDLQTSTTTTMAYYPSPGGATESLLDLRTWSDIAAQYSDLETLEPDIRAALVRRSADGTCRCFVVPIDACYELVGIVRTHWTGFGGGPEVQQHIDAFFAAMVERADRRHG